ncbi:class I SAM-dependent methyltransferase [Bradyrhizobium sp. LHD-71]|uniref:class I SAM-dependent methyltransferase n=1 Tax=Bradyrhizobium sp. LHD-71 TaxID=3072141 RepID=UPI00280E4700|nr:class I SAM-dependent methyltransferase [Bradyrhizobium sp. LHD-71]MDQ8731075.1 class I SAM-dependent methyltransferase [Bradyrhizobium sp. LHD-71]
MLPWGMPLCLDASPFAGTAQYYDRFRAPYAQAAIDFIIETYDLSEGVRALDLGCGPGTITIPLSCAVAEVIAVDPDADMIAEGRRLAASRGQQNIRWLQSRAEDISPEAGPFRVATIGQAFHWMDRDEVLRKLAILTADGGGLALVNPGRRRPQESWEPVASEIVAEFLGPRTRHPKSNPQEPEHEPALRRSEYFSQFTAREFPSTIARDVSSIIGCIYSTSNSTRSLFGDDTKAFEAELSRALLSLNPAGVFNEHVETEVVVAPKRTR